MLIVTNYPVEEAKVKTSTTKHQRQPSTRNEGGETVDGKSEVAEQWHSNDATRPEIIMCAYRALWRETRSPDERDIWVEWTTHMHEHAWTPPNGCTRNARSRSVAGRPSVPKHAGSLCLAKRSSSPIPLFIDTREYSCAIVIHSC